MKFAVTLDEQKSARVLDRAARAQAQVVLELSGEPPTSWCGQFVSADESVILVELTRDLPVRSDALTGRYVEVQIYTDQRYLLSTHIIGTGGRLERRQVTLERPAHVQVLQRRRFWRTPLAPSSHVHVTCADGPRLHEIDAPLLNVCAEGLACLVPQASAAPFRTGLKCTLRFELPHAPAPFEFTATIRNKTPGADSNEIVGFQFQLSDVDKASAAQNLRACLYQRQSSLLETEVQA